MTKLTLLCATQTFSHCGWMTKAGEGRLGRRSFKRRWFQMQLQGTELAYFDGVTHPQSTVRFVPDATVSADSD